MADLTPIVAAIITVLGTLITSYLIPWIRAKIAAEKLAKVLSVTNTVVLAVEQVYKALGGEAKKEKALEEAKAWLAKYNIVVDDQVVSDAIEAAVKQMNIAIKGE